MAIRVLGVLRLALVFHDDQHGAAIIAAAAVHNGLELMGKDLGKVELVVSGAIVAVIAILDLLVGMGLNRAFVWAGDLKGLIHDGRGDSSNPQEARYAQRSSLRTLGDVMPGACDGEMHGDAALSAATRAAC